MISVVMMLSTALLGKPLAPISYTACLTKDPRNADLIAREVTTVQEARWCFTIVDNCKAALVVVYKHPRAEQSYVVSASCK